MQTIAARNAARGVAFRGPARSAARAPRTATIVRDSPGKEWMLQQPGISAPFNEPYFDPAGFTESPTLTVNEAKRWREAELTHGRVAMLGALGWLVQEEFHPLFGGQIGGPAFRHFQEIESIFPQFWEIVLLAIGITEGFRISRGWNDPREKEQIQADYTPGDLGFDPLGLYPSDEAAQKELKTKELNNGRLAMISIAGFAAQEEVDHITIWKGLVKENIVPASEANLLPY